MSKHRISRVRWLASVVLLLLAGCSGLLPFDFGDSDTPEPAWTLQPTEEPAAPTLLPTVVFTPTPEPTLEPMPTPTATSEPENCWNASYVADGTIPDGTWMKPGTTFEKVWRARNDGVCDWQDVTLVPVEGDPMGSTTITVPPAAAGQTVDITTTLTAPTVEGDYRSVWRYSTGGKTFDMLTVVIRVSNTEPRPGLIPPLPTLPPLPPFPPLPDL